MPGKKACTCTKSGDSTATATAEHPTKVKRCATCGKDVTHEKRMKDSATGKYWCYDCGIKQPGAKEQAALCPLCKKAMSIHSMYRHEDHYICQTCHDAMSAGKGAKQGGSKKVIVLVAVALLIAAVAAYLNGLIPLGG
jgi:DNA-directed RNA polymerase subunit RPC12/RpoP